jgi:class 3 adenylate cyclase
MSELPTGTVTLLFTDIEGSTRSYEAGRRLDVTAVVAIVLPPTDRQPN